MTTLAQLTPLANPFGGYFNRPGAGLGYTGADQILFQMTAASLVPVDGGGGYVQLNASVPGAVGITMWEQGGTLDLTTLIFQNFTVNDFTGTTGHFAAIFGSAGEDTVIANNVNFLMMGEGGNDTLTGGSIEDYIYGGADNDILNGGGWGDSLWGDGGIDTIHGDAGADNMWGGDGADEIYSEDGNTGEGVVDGGDGADKLFINRATAEGPLIFSRSTGLGSAVITEGSSTWNVSNFEEVSVTGTSQADVLDSVADLNIFYSGGGSDVIDITVGKNIVNAGEGDDTIIATLIADVDQLIDGGDGAGDLLMLDAQSISTDFDMTVASLANVELLPFIQFSNFERMDGTFGSGANEVTGGTLADRILGMAGNDLLAGGAGDDELFGGANNDVLHGDAGVDTLDGGSGNDVLVSGVGETVEGDYSGGDGIDELDIIRSGSSANLVVTATQVIDESGTWNISGFERLVFTGGGGNDDVTAFGTYNNIFGGAGNDTVTSFRLYDQVSGGAGQDHLILDRRSNFGEFSFNFEASRLGLEALGLDPNANNTQYNGYWGFETFTVKGSAYGDQVTGDAGDDVFTGYAGRDTLSGLGGADRLDGGDGIDAIDGGAGNDIIYGGAGGDSLDGGDDNDTIVGGDGLDIIEGGGGNDFINGGRGGDIMDGGAGNDRYYVDDVTDIVAEVLDGGVDTVISSATFHQMSGQVERLYLSGVLGNAATGNALSNILVGNAAGNVLDGGVGNDYLRGGLGRDTLTGGDGYDRFDFDDVAESLPGAAARDVITDFTRGRDRIDLSTIDAISGGANDAFTLLARGTASSAVGAGQIGWYMNDLAGTANDSTVLRINSNGDAAIEMEIMLRGLVTLTAANFWL